MYNTVHSIAHLSYNQLVDLTKTGRQESNVRIINLGFSIKYCQKNQYVELLSRYSNKPLVVVSKNNNKIITATTLIYQSNVMAAQNFTGVNFQIIPKGNLLRVKYTHYVYNSISKRVYIPSETVVTPEGYILASDYYKPSYDKEWNKKFIKKVNENINILTSIYNISKLTKHDTLKYSKQNASLFNYLLALDSNEINTDNVKIVMGYLYQVYYINKPLEFKKILKRYVAENKASYANKNDKLIYTKTKNVL